MDVFVIPVGADRYELYCEQPVAGDEPIEPTTGWIGRLRRKFGGLIRAAEERHRTGPPGDDAAKGWAGKIQDLAMASSVSHGAAPREAARAGSRDASRRRSAGGRADVGGVGERGVSSYCIKSEPASDRRFCFGAGVLATFRLPDRLIGTQ